MSQPDRQPAGAEQALAEQSQYLTFKLDREMFAIGILSIREIIEYGQVTTVPMMPAFVRGVINLRGSVVPVIDLKARLGRSRSELQRRTCIVVLEIEHGQGFQEIGIVVDEVSEVMEIPPSEIEPAPSFGARIRTDFISGMGKVDDRFVIVLNVQRVLDEEEIAALAGVDTAAEAVGA